MSEEKQQNKERIIKKHFGYQRKTKNEEQVNKMVSYGDASLDKTDFTDEYKDDNSRTTTRTTTKSSKKMKRNMYSSPALSKMQNTKLNERLIMTKEQIPRSLSHGFIDYHPDKVMTMLFELPYYGAIGLGSHLKKVVQDAIKIQKKSLDTQNDISNNPKMRRREQSIQDFQQILNQGYTFNLIIAIIQGLIAPFIFGYSISCINLPQKTIKHAMGLDGKDDLFRLLTSLLFIGGFVGSILGSKLGDCIGRKKAFIVNDFIYMVSSAIGFVSGLSYVKEKGKENDTMFALFCVSRFLLGVAACLGGTITPMYLGEVSPPLIRGQIGTLNQLFLTFGQTFAVIIGYNRILGHEDRWPYLILLYGCVPVLQLITLWSFPESPKWLLQKDKEQEAKIALMRLRQTDNIGIDMIMMQKAIRKDSEPTSNGNFGNISINATQETKTNKKSKKAIYMAALISIVLMSMQQFSGINLIFLYSTKTLREAGLKHDVQLWIGTIIVYCANSGAVLIAASLIDKLGRKMLMYISSFGMICASILISIALAFEDNPNNSSHIWGYLVLVSMFITVVTFEMGLGPIPWLFSAEISPSSHRGMITGLNTFVNQAAGWFIAYFGETIGATNARYTPFIVVLLVGTLFLKLYVPETKGKEERQILKEMENIKLC